MPTQISPSSGVGCLYTQGGPGASPGYAAIDIRRGDSTATAQGIINTGAYLVTQRAAGATQSVDIAASSGYAYVAGNTIANQGIYTVAPHSGVINEAIAAADPSNPRLDQVILRVYDSTIDSTGNNFARVEVLTGTPQVGATLANRSGAASLSANAMRLADVLVPAGSTSVTNASIKDRRPRTRGAATIATTESRTSTSYGLLATPDVVPEVVLPTDGRLIIMYQAIWQESANGVGRAAVFLGANQIQVQRFPSTAPAPVTQAAATASSLGLPNTDVPLFTSTAGLVSGQASSGATADVTTGQIIGGIAANNTGANLAMELGGTVLSNAAASNTYVPMCGALVVFAAAGTYDVSVQFKSSSGSVTAKNRKLSVAVWDPAMGVLS
jgi:hypothetical protein